MDIFAPDIYAQSIYTINYNSLKKSGIKCLLFDLDNTLCPISAKVPGIKEKELIEGLKDMKFKVIIISNSGKERLEPFKEGFNVDTAFKSRKPLKTKYQKIQRIYGFKESEIAAIGDQIVTDVFGANRMGFTSIFVNPISKQDFNRTKFNRFLEKIIMKKLNKKGLFTKGEYHD